MKNDCVPTMVRTANPEIFAMDKINLAWKFFFYWTLDTMLHDSFKITIDNLLNKTFKIGFKKVVWVLYLVIMSML